MQIVARALLGARNQPVPYIPRWRACQYLLFPTSGSAAFASWYTAASGSPVTTAFLAPVPRDRNVLREACTDLGVFSAPLAAPSQDRCGREFQRAACDGVKWERAGTGTRGAAEGCGAR